MHESARISGIIVKKIDRNTENMFSISFRKFCGEKTKQLKVFTSIIKI